MKRFKRLLSILLITAMILPMIPVGEIRALAADVKIDAIRITKTSNNLTDDWETSTVQIRGEYLDKVLVGYIGSRGDEVIPLVQIPGGNSSNFRQFRIPNDKNIGEIYVDGKPYDVKDTGMPRVISVDPKPLDLSSDDDKRITVMGVNFGEFRDPDSGTTISIDNQDVTKTLSGLTDDEFVLDEEVIKKIKRGNKDISIQRNRKAADGVTIEMLYKQNNAFKIIETIKIDEDDINIYPNKGQVGSEVTVTLNGTTENYSVFFLDTENQLFKYDFMGEEQVYKQTTETKKIISVKVPKGLKTGTTYKVFITNDLKSVYDESKKGDDLSQQVYMQKNIGDFYVVDAGVGPMVSGTDPKEGTSEGASVTVYGYRLDELDIEKLKKNGKAVKNLEIHDDRIIDRNGQKLEIIYKKDGLKYNGEEVTSITRQFGVSIGRDVIFEEVDGKEYLFEDTDKGLDKLFVRTQVIEPKDLEDPKKDVVVEMRTTIVTENYNIEIIETPSHYGYTFLRAYQEPIIESVSPNKIQVISKENNKTKNTTIISIQGEGFNVLRHNEGGRTISNYPNIVIGGTNEDTAEILIRKDKNGNVTYKTKTQEEKIIRDATLVVLDRYGKVVTGAEGDEEGSTIVVTIPEGLEISPVSIGSKLPIAVANPKRGSEDKGDIYSYKLGIIEFVTPTTSPTIESLVPAEDTVSGGKEIVIKGRGFKDPIEVYMAGVKVENVEKDIDRETTRGVLKFKAPPGREGLTIVQVINTEDGGSDTRDFLYVEDSKMDPKITSISPPIGTEDDVIIIRGDNFLKADPTVPDTSGINMSKLIGSRVFLGDEEVNKYVQNGGLGEYTPPQNVEDTLLKIVEDTLSKTTNIGLSQHYRQAKVEDLNGNPYKISKDREGNVVLIGKNKTYTFELEDGEIVARDGSKSYTVDQSNEEIVLISPSGEDVLKVDFNYKLFSVQNNQFGRGELRVANYHDSLILDANGKYYKVIESESGNVTITDESDNTYEIKVSGSQIMANNHLVTVNATSLEFDGKTFDFKTPYYFNEAGIITGHKVRVLNASEIEIIVPRKGQTGPYDVKVQNPDTKSFTVKGGFTYTDSKQRPIINYIDPAEGSVDGGYYITIKGENFGDNPEVRIHGTLVSKANTIVNKQDYKSIKVLVPKYTDAPFTTDKKYVRVHVTTGGASTSRKDLFAYKVASSNPIITKIRPGKGSAAGGNVVEIEGTDFRFFEPYKGDAPRDGDTNYEDIDGNGKWTNYLTEADLTGIPLNDPSIKDYETYVDSPVLPSIYFGDNKARIVEFTKLSGDNYRIMVLAPTKNDGGSVDVYLKNNDSGQSKPVKYNYESSKPQIKVLNPSTGRIVGGESIDLVGSGYAGSKIKLVGPNKSESDPTMYLVRFGEITNRNIPRENANSGLIKGPVGAKVELKDSGFTAEIKGESLSLTLKQGGKEYKGSYKLKNEIKYIDLKGLKTSDNESYPGFELVKVEIDDGRLLVDRGFAPTVTERVSGTLESNR